MRRRAEVPTAPADDRARFEPITVRIADAVRMTGIGRSKLYELIKAGELDTVKVGCITLVPVESLRRLVRGEP